MAAEFSPIALLKDENEAKSPPLPATPSETITALVHYYRGEMGRMAGWRDRIDRTSNWAITVVAALLSVSLSSPASHHGVLLFAMLLITLLLFIEARRYRFFDVYRARVRRIERGYFAQMLAPQAPFKPNWAAPIADSLRRPAFLMSYREAVCRRLRRNYCWMYLILLLAWGLKISSPLLQADGGAAREVASLAEIAGNAALGPVSGWLVIGIVAAFYLLMVYAALHKEPSEGELAHGEVHV
ncbi:DUF2270 domain-containing protein [Rhizobium sp. LjRoot98]|uniref:DUF2270 domain-containing protein n=1 Tax=unclassified Rhizobium TaxID=2613769 RepID=UPI000714FE4D|nr:MULTISPECIES: DUF2270 domain-containing protein [unclassified Rhizobium]KQV29597.1 hypothetical protein ASC96_13275 [Rhizobium sp. Root1204]KQY10606.1 hypothetical protein ASD36_07650 [Rhizobium sp. Root1334]KRC04603.1 hypothetical protein ASE23_05415 [Rhizobium sp. Root73]